MHRQARRQARGPAQHPAVALTVDTEAHPPKVLLVRGRAELDVVAGIPNEDLQVNGAYAMTPQQRAAWEAEVRSLDDGMVRVVVTPTWAKLVDVGTTLPSAVAELVGQRDQRQRGWAPRRVRRRELRAHQLPMGAGSNHQQPHRSRGRWRRLGPWGPDQRRSDEPADRGIGRSRGGLASAPSAVAACLLASSAAPRPARPPPPVAVLMWSGLSRRRFA